MKIKCASCSAEFDAQRRSALFCSDRCRQRDRRESQTDNQVYWQTEALRLREEVARLRQEASKPRPTFAEQLTKEAEERLAHIFRMYPTLTPMQRLRLEMQSIGVHLEFMAFFSKMENQAAAWAPTQPRAQSSWAELNPIKHAFSLLGLTPAASMDDVNKARRIKARELHPDINPNGAEQMKAINGAYATIKEHFNNQQGAFG